MLKLMKIRIWSKGVSYIGVPTPPPPPRFHNGCSRRVSTVPPLCCTFYFGQARGVPDAIPRCLTKLLFDSNSTIRIEGWNQLDARSMGAPGGLVIDFDRYANPGLNITNSTRSLAGLNLSGDLNAHEA